MAARKRKTVLSDNWKDKIRVSMLMNRLVDHSLGKIEMSASQVRALEIVLSKLVPSLASTASDVTVKHSYLDTLARVASLEVGETPKVEVEEQRNIH